MTLCVLACAKNDKYLKRLGDFVRHYGYKNSKNYARIAFLVEDEVRPDFIPQEHMWYNCPGTPLSCRFLKYLKDFNDESDWIMQVDDDSSTDLDKTFELLNRFYNHQDSMMLMGGRNTDLEMSQQNIIKTMGCDDFFFGSSNISKFDTHPYFVHAWEPTIVSNRAVKTIKAWARLDEYINLCLRHRPTFGDQTPYVVAKLAKIPIVECTFMSPFNKNTEYSAINPNGRYSHIHYVTEKWDGYEDFKRKMTEAKEGIIGFKIDPPKANFWEFWGGAKGKERLYGTINLNEDGTIGLYSNDNEFFWKGEGDTILFFNINNDKTCAMQKVSDDEFSGAFIPNPHVNHKIIKVKK
jgi:hypothetical protein